MNLIELSNSVREVQIYVTVWHTQQLGKGLKNDMMTMCVGTLDMALSRFNTSLLQAQQHPLVADRFYKDLTDCAATIKKFYRWTLILRDWPRWLMWAPVLMLDWIGKKQIPKIKSTHKKILTTINDSD